MRGEQLSLFCDKYERIDGLVSEYFWAYHAGMADGDGCFYNKKDLRYQIGLIDKNIIKELADLYQLKVVKPKGKNKKHKQLYRVSLCTKNGRHFISRVAPYLVEKRNIIKEICKEHNIEIKDVAPIDLSHRIHWLSGYFDAEGHICMRPSFNKKSNNYTFKFNLRFTSSKRFVLRVVRRIMNFIFNRDTDKKTLLNMYEKKENRPNHKQCYDLEMRQTSKIHLFAKAFIPFIKVKRKINTFKRIAKYARFCAWQKWQFGHINFKKNTELRERWLKASEME